MSRLPFDLSVPTPCRQPWHEMSGSGAQRHCASCSKTVHNLATLTPHQIEHLIRASNGHLCARITRREDGSVITADSRSVQGSFSSAFVLASALAAIPAIAQDTAQPQAVVTGTVLTPKNNQYIHSDSPREVLFIQNDQAVFNTTTDATGKFTATLPAGTYDVVFRNGPMWGERVKAVDLHPGIQEFCPVRETFNFGHLGEVDQLGATYVTVGEVSSILWYRITPRNLLLHPVATAREIAWKAKRLLHLSS